MKKVIFVFALMLVFQSGVVFGQDIPKNSLAVGFSYSLVLPIGAGPGISIEYERLINKMFSISFDVGMDMFVFPYAEIKGRWFPWSGAFFVGVSAGFWSIFPFENVFSLLAISPNIGWRIPIGNHLVLLPSFTTRLIFLDELFNMNKLSLQIGYRF